MRESNDISTIVERIALARKIRQLGSRELSRMAGLSEAAVSRIEKRASDRTIEVSTLLKLAKALRVRPTWLLSGEEPIEEISSAPAQAK